MSLVCVLLAVLFAVAVFEQGAEVRIQYAPAASVAAGRAGVSAPP